MAVTPASSFLVGTDTSLAPLSQGHDDNTGISPQSNQFECENTNQDPAINERQPHQSGELEGAPQNGQSQRSGRILSHSHSHSHPSRMSLQLEEIQQQTPGESINDENYPLEGQTQETFTQHELSQTNGDLTQLGIDDDESDDDRKNPCCSPAAIDPLTLPWGRLMPVALNNNPEIHNFNPKSKSGDTNKNHSKGIALDMTPRSPTRSGSIATRSRSPLASSEKSPGGQSMDTTACVNFLGLKNLRLSDRFNEYLVGRSVRCDATVEKLDIPTFGSETNNGESDEQKIKREAKVKQRDYVHSMISNRHCRIYCLLNLPDHGVQDSELTPSSTSSTVPEMEVFVEDTSGNGTLINGTVLLSRNERRKLHTGDVICLINPKVLAKRVRSTSERKIYMSQYSYVFVNLYEQEARNLAIASDWSFGGRGRGRVRGRSRSGDSSLSPAVRRRIMEERIKRQSNAVGKVNVRAMKCHSINIESKNCGVAASEKHGLHAGNQLPPSLGTNLSGLSRVPNLQSDSTAARRIEEDYDLRDLLGSGMCGEVRRAIHRRSGEERAVKIISISVRAGLGNSGSNFVSSEKLKAIQAEAEILRSLDHPYIVKLYDVYVSPGKAIYLVMELVKGGEMFDRIVTRGKYPEVQARRVFRRILTAVHHLHEERHIVHRDLKPENILMVDRRSDVNIKISDFGVAKNMTSEGLKTFCGTPLYFAPEVISRQNTVKGKGRYGKEADCWSIGVILYIILCGSPPFDVSGGFDVAASADIVFYKDQWKGISREARELVIGLLEKDPKKRMSVNDACKHSWVLMDDGDTHTNPLHDPAITSRHASKSTTVAESVNFVETKADNELESRNLPTDVSPVTVASQLSPKDAAENKNQVSRKKEEVPISTIFPVEGSSPPQSQIAEIDKTASTISSSNLARSNSFLISELNRYHLSNVIHQANDSLEEYSHSSPIKRRKLFPMRSGEDNGPIRKITKNEVNAIKYAGVSVPKPCLRIFAQNDNNQGISGLMQSNQKMKRKVQQSLFKTSPDIKPDHSVSRIPTFSLNQHNMQPKTFVDITNLKGTNKFGQPVNDSSKSEECTNQSDDELQSDFSFDGEEVQAMHDEVGLSWSTSIKSLGKGKLASTEVVTPANKHRQLVQTFLFGKPPPPSEDPDSNGYAERHGVGKLVIAENHHTLKKIPDPKESHRTTKTEQISSGKPIKTISKTSQTQKTLKNWFQPKK